MSAAPNQSEAPSRDLGDEVDNLLDRLARVGLKIGPRERINAAALTANLVGAGATRSLEDLKPLLAPLLARSPEERRLFLQTFTASAEAGGNPVSPKRRREARPWLPVVVLALLLFVAGLLAWRLQSEPVHGPTPTADRPPIPTAASGGRSVTVPSQTTFESLNRIAEAARHFEGAPTIEELARALAADPSRKLNWPAESYAIRLHELSGLPRQWPLPLYDGQGLVWARLALALERTEQPGYESELERLAASAAQQAPAKREQESVYGIAAQLPERLGDNPPNIKTDLFALIRSRTVPAPSDRDAPGSLSDMADEFTIARALALTPVVKVPESAYAGAPWLPRNDPAANTAPALVPWIAALVPLTLALLWLANSLALRKAYLRRRPPQVPPLQLDLVAEAGTRVSYAARQFGQIAQRLQLRTPRTTDELDIRATIAATVAAGGEIVTPVYREARDTPEYLVLIERNSAADQDALRLRGLLGRLEKLKLMQFTVFYFTGEPSFLEPDRGGRAVPIEAVQARYAGHRLVILGSGAELLDPASLGPHPATAKLRHWEKRALLTPLPLAEWGRKEFALAHALDMPIGRATTEGLLVLAELIGLDGAERDGLLDPTGDGLARPLPEILRIRPQRFLYGAPPAGLPVPQLIQQLRNFLDGPVFEWLCALAVYPAVQWDLTLYLGLALRQTAVAGDGKPLYREDRIAALTQLPWLREGQMPNWVRRALIAELHPDRAKEIRAVLQHLLKIASPKGDRVGEEAINLRVARDIVRDRLAPDELFEDEVLLDFLARGRIEDFALFNAGSWLERFLPRRWIDRIGIPELAAGLVAAAYVVAAAWLAPKPADGPLPTGAWLPLVLLAAGGLFALAVANPANAYRTVRGALVRTCTPALGFVLLFAGYACYLLAEAYPPLQAVLTAVSSPYPISRPATDAVTLALAAASWLIANRIRDRLNIPRRRPHSRIARVALPAVEILVLAVLAGVGADYLRAIDDAGDWLSLAVPAAAGLVLFATSWMAARLLPERLLPPPTAPRQGYRLWSIAGSAMQVTLALVPILLAVALAGYVAASDEALLPLHHGASAVAETPDHRFLAVADMDGEVRVFEGVGTRHRLLGATIKNGTAPAMSIALQRVNNRIELAVGDGDGTVHLYDAQDGSRLELPRGFVGLQAARAPARVALDVDGTLVAAIERPDGTASLVAADDTLDLMEGGPVTAIAAIGNRRFALATLDGRLRVLLAPAGEAPRFTDNGDEGIRLPGRVRILKVEEHRDTRHPELLAIGDDGTMLHGHIDDGRIEGLRLERREQLALGSAKEGKGREKFVSPL